MTTMFQVTKKCVVCGKESTHFQIGSTNAFGSMDLDLRPPAMKRDTMPEWAEQCPYCGYVAEEIDQEREERLTVEMVKKALDNKSLNLSNKLARKFYNKYLIQSQFGESDYRSQFFDLLHAAWACDDAKDVENATNCRKLALNALDLYLNSADDAEDNINLRVCKADLLRRSGQFKEVIEFYNVDEFDDELLKLIVRFQVERAKAEDTACYTVEQAQCYFEEHSEDEGDNDTVKLSFFERIKKRFIR